MPSQQLQCHIKSASDNDQQVSSLADFYQLSSRSNLRISVNLNASRIFSPTNHSSSKPFCRLWPRKCKSRKPKMIVCTLLENQKICPKIQFSGKFWIWIFTLKSHTFWESLKGKITWIIWIFAPKIMILIKNRIIKNWT